MDSSLNTYLVEVHSIIQAICEASGVPGLSLGVSQRVFSLAPGGETYVGTGLNVLERMLLRRIVLGFAEEQAGGHRHPMLLHVFSAGETISYLFWLETDIT